jgi:carbamate kinase
VAAILARQLEAEVLMILTDVDAVYHGWGTPERRPIRRMTPAQAEELVAGGQLDVGGMKPKVEAAAGFVRDGGARAIIARLAEGPAALRGETGTTITREP